MMILMKSLEIIEDEDEEDGGNKRDESRSHRDYEAALEGEDDDDDMDEGEEGEEDLEERGMMMKKMEASIKENRQLRRENRRYEKALTFLKKRIDEVNLFNSRLAAASDSNAQG